jgi:short-subunit dehydrogenase
MTSLLKPFVVKFLYIKHLNDTGARMAKATSMSEFAKHYGPVALITGASSGIGKSFAESLAAQGFDLVLVARRLERLETLAGVLRGAHGVEVNVHRVDLADGGAADQILDVTSSLDVGLVVSNAGTGDKGRFESGDASVMAKTLMVNCNTPMLLAHGFVPRLKLRGRGGIIFTSSVEGLIGCPFSTVYSSTKGFLNSLGEALWGELAPEGIDVLTLCPGATATDRLQGIDPATLHNVMSPDEVVRLTLENIRNGPIYISSEHYKKTFGQLLSMPRDQAISAMAKSMKK